jgi:hypothetical protein
MPILLSVCGNVPAAASPALACQADWFQQFQQSATEQVKGQLWSHWLPKCLYVFRHLPPVPINGDADAYFRSGWLKFLIKMLNI